MNLLKPKLQIAVDGPVAAGKGTTSKLLAEKLDILYVDTGAMYRALTFFTLDNKVDPEVEKEVCDLLTKQKPQVMLEAPSGEKKDGRLITVLLDGQDVSWKIRTEQVSIAVSVITTYRCVREYMVPQQQKLAVSKGVVMEGRDITTKVLPQADLKIYLDAKEETRARRRYQGLLAKGELADFDKVLEDLKERDYRDSHREIDPLQIVDDAWVLDTTDMTIEQVVDVICDKLQEMGLISL